MVRPIGERFWFPLDPDTTIQLEVAKERLFRSCAGCYFDVRKCWKHSIRQYTGSCHYKHRGTVCGVIFKEVKEGGENDPA